MLPETASPGIGKMRRPERRGVSGRSAIKEAKSKVETIDLADRLCGPGKMRRMGDRWVARCPLPNHADKSPSFVVYVESNSWYCFGACQRGGDVIDLAAAAWGYGEGEMAMAAADLLHEFNHPMPEKPQSWFTRQDRQLAIRNRIDDEKIEHIRLLVFRLLWLPWLKRLPESVRDTASDSAWKESATIARMLYEQRGGV